jgi:hypothetical protein
MKAGYDEFIGLKSRIHQLEEITKNLSMLVKRLSRFAPPDVAADATDYLLRQGFLGSPLRSQSDTATEPK